ncbi:MAG: tRNA isopentenyl-2-thiomethyl-A-37 hydroxylase MiaE [Shewanella sp.]|nr:tRNA isopentenyl-2-thiomethyl-A-37 hydroxylase MiaE [Shewanella sp.]MCF1429817.1 tRNA isopentenyl-2-thiomethyl-A-37 hydroxylase MiaE [Shewanella sp.]MCF1438523.1 tRNA isopentenyl-2-thiomethyl-A-37 hydroxylase MiaE [Shewanella sp.]MCF1456815.1 tRNA isopentenyl-2-thiomethyl-A-37 hydroxylase MiaE [Shewanella sp.]
MYQSLLAPVIDFLGCQTSQAWIRLACQQENLSLILIDHCNCELKAAQNALFMVRKYGVDEKSGEQLLAWARPYEEFVYHNDRDIHAFLARDFSKSGLKGPIQVKPGVSWGDELINKMLRLVREEFHHFEQVLEIMQARGIKYQNLRAGRYARDLMRHVRTYEPLTLIDRLIVGAFIEARSCERFAALAPYMDVELEKFYVSLLRSEARHYQDYLALAQQVADEPIDARVAYWRELEVRLICEHDTEFRFHSGTPAEALSPVS